MSQLTVPIPPSSNAAIAAPARSALPVVSSKQVSGGLSEGFQGVLTMAAAMHAAGANRQFANAKPHQTTGAIPPVTAATSQASEAIQPGSKTPTAVDAANLSVPVAQFAAAAAANVTAAGQADQVSAPLALATKQTGNHDMAPTAVALPTKSKHKPGPAPEAPATPPISHPAEPVPAAAARPVAPTSNKYLAEPSPSHSSTYACTADISKATGAISSAPIAPTADDTGHSQATPAADQITDTPAAAGQVDAAQGEAAPKPDNAAATASPSAGQGTPPAQPAARPAAGRAAGATTGQIQAAAVTDAAGAALAAPTPAPDTSAAAPVAGAPHSSPAPASPATQTATALTGIHIAPGANGHVTIHLQPADLGAVEVRIERAHDGSATVTVQVEKSEALHSFQQDLPHLHQALDRAGLPSEGRQVTLNLAPSAGSDTQAGAGGSGEGQRQNTAPRQQQPQHAPAADLPEDATGPEWRPAGVNITA